MDIDVMGWIRRNIKPQMVTAEDALPGRDTPVLHPIPVHELLDRPLDEVPEGAEVAYFAMGCFWGVERMFWETDGVLNTAAGYMAGFTPNPTYREVCTGSTGHTETVRVVFDPSRVSYEDLLRLFWENHDPTTANRQGNDIGTQYRSGIYTTSDAQLEAARRSAKVFQSNLREAGYDEITTELAPDQDFWFAEVEHQQYLHKNPNGYCPIHATGVKCGP